MIRFLFLLLCISPSLFFSLSQADDANLTSSTLNSPLAAEGRPPPASLKVNQSKAPFKPGIAITVGALTSAFSLTFLILLYVKHCKSSNNGYPNTSRGGTDPYSARKNSGIDPNVIDLLPVFRFGSLRGPKDGLECAVCLTNYEASEVLRLLPKCKHAFHVECVDTWLDAHSTCPLCRYRVDPEDFLLVEHNKILPPQEEKLVPEIHRISGRHSSAGEKGGHLQVIVEKPSSMGSRRSLDSSISSGTVSIGCFDRPRKDQLLLAGGRQNRADRRVQHRIVVSSSEMTQQRWSDVQASELLYIRSEMLMSDSRRVSAANGKEGVGENINEESGRNEINKRSVSEITGISRRRSNEVRQRQQQAAGFVYRWLAWISDSNPSPAVPLPQPPTFSSTE